MSHSIQTEIHYVIKYIYVQTAGGGSHRMATLPPEALAGLRFLAGVAQSGKVDPITKKKLDDFSKAVQALMHKIRNVPSAGIREMLMSMLTACIQKAASGDIDGALNDIGELNNLTDRCRELCDQILNNIHQLKMSLDVQGPAGALLEAIGDAAMQALNGAGSLEGLEEVADLTDRAVNIGKKLEDCTPGSKEYNDLMAQLTDILNALLQMPKGDNGALEGGPSGDGMGATMAQDNNAIAASRRSRLTEQFAQLQSRNTDSVTAGKLNQLQSNLIGMLVEAGGLQNQEAFGKRLDEIMALAASGKVDQALELSIQLSIEIKQSCQIQGHLDRRLDRLGAEVEKMHGPARMVAEQVLLKLTLMRQNTNDPAELHRIDTLIAEAMSNSVQPGTGQLARSASYQALLKLNRELGDVPGSGPDMSPPAQMALDQWQGGGGTSGGASVSIDISIDLGGAKAATSPGAAANLANLSNSANASSSASIAMLAELRGLSSKCGPEGGAALAQVISFASKARLATAGSPQQARFEALLSACVAEATLLSKSSPGSRDSAQTVARLKALLQQMKDHGGSGTSGASAPEHAKHHHHHHKKQACPVVESVVIPPIPQITVAVAATKGAQPQAQGLEFGAGAK